MSNNKDEKILWVIVRAGLLVIAAFFLFVGVFGNQPCDIDKQYLSCRLSGTIGDWLGCILYFGGSVYMSGIVKGLKNFTNPPATTRWNIIVFAGTLLGVVLFWNL